MALIIEDGSNVSNSNSYVTTSELSSYASDRDITITGDTEVLLIKAMDYIEGLQFQGNKTHIDQSLQWPRYNVWIDGYYFLSNQIPKELKKGQIEVALAIDAGNDLLADIPRQKKAVTVGEISVEYESGQALTIVRKVSNSLYKLLSSSGSSFKVGRG